MVKTKTTTWDVTDHLENDEDVTAYLEAALEDGDHQVIAAAVGDIARVKGMSRVAREAGLGRESLYKSLSAGGNPEFATILKVLRVLGIRLRATIENAGEFPVASNPTPASTLADDGEPAG